MPKKKATGRKTGKFAAYYGQGRRKQHKINRLARKWKHYKVQPPLALNGIIDKDMRLQIQEKIIKLKGNNEKK